MNKLLSFLVIFLFLLFVTPISAKTQNYNNDEILTGSSNLSNKRSSPRIDKFYTSIPEKDNWVMVPKDSKKITFYGEASNTETVLFWLIPTGTQTWNERELIGYDINKNGDGKFKFTWKIDRHLHDHLQIQALGENEISGSIINIGTYP